MSKYLLIGVSAQCLLAGMLLANTGVGQHLRLNEVFLSVSWNEMKIKNAFQTIEKKTEFEFVYFQNSVNTDQAISLSADNISLEALLTEISSRTDLQFKRVNSVIYVKKQEQGMAPVVEQSEAAQVQITGKVTSADDGQALPGVSIVVKGTSTGTTTDFDGNYRLTVPANAEILSFSYIGFVAQEVAIGSQTVINVVMTADAKQLQEVVVTAFGLEKDKKALGYSVTQVGGEEFVQSRAINLGSALSGKIAGVNVTPTASGAAGSTRVLIRGGSSLNGNDQPLYVINGIPMDNSNLGSAGMWGGNDNGDGLSALNPDDIESLSVLKGATASALYGSRAANGVILITTKSGKAGKMQVSVNSNFTVDRVNDITDFQTEYGHGSNNLKPTTQESALANGQNSWGARLDGSPVLQFDGVTRPYSNLGEGLNDFYRTGYTWTNTVDFTGGTEKMNYRVSASDLTNNDIMPNSGFDRRMLNANLGGTFGKFELKVSAQYSKENAKNRPRLSDSPGNANTTVLMKSPAISFETMKGTTDKLGAKPDGTELRHQGNTFAQNPYWASYQFERMDEKDRILGNAQLKYNITDWLYLQGRVGTDVIAADFRTVEAYGTAYKPFGDTNESRRLIREDNADIWLGFAKEFGKFSVDAIVGGNRMRRINENTRVGGNNLVIPFFHSVNNVNPANRSYSFDFGEFGINSAFGSANFSYSGFLFLNVTGRQDWFSTLSKDNNSIFYPSVGLSYVLSEMVELPSVVSFAKLRASWAQVGGGIPDPYVLNLTYGLDQNPLAGATRGSIANGSIPNSTLKPYLTTEYEFGVDMRFLSNRLGVDFTYYNRTTTDNILNTTISRTSGFGSTLINIGELNNRGIELLVSATPVQTPNFTWEVSFNMANNVSEAVNLGKNAAGEPIQNLNLGQARTLQEQIRHVVGQRLGLIAGYRHRTINGQKVYDANGFPVRSANFEILGEGRHPFSAGIGNTLTYKNFRLNFLVDMRDGGSMYSGTNVLAYAFGLHKETVPGRETGLTVSGVDVNGNPLTVEIPAANMQAYYNRYNDITEYFVYNASFAKLRELSIGYSIPRSILSKTPIQSANISAVGRNLLLLWSNIPNVDPESGYTANADSQGLEFFAMPPVRNLGFNLSMTF